MRGSGTDGRTDGEGPGRTTDDRSGHGCCCSARFDRLENDRGNFLGDGRWGTTAGAATGPTTTGGGLLALCLGNTASYTKTSTVPGVNSAAASFIIYIFF